MAEELQPSTLAEGATTGDIEDELPESKAKSGDDKKAAAALANLDARGDDDVGKTGKGVDQEQLSKAMGKLGTAQSKDGATKGEVKKFKIDQAEVSLLIDQLDLSKQKATDLLRQHGGDATKAMRAFIAIR